MGKGKKALEFYSSVFNALSPGAFSTQPLPIAFQQESEAKYLQKIGLKELKEKDFFLGAVLNTNKYST